MLVKLGLKNFIQFTSYLFHILIGKMNQWLDLEIDPSEQNTRSPVCLAPRTHISM